MARSTSLVVTASFLLVAMAGCVGDPEPEAPLGLESDPDAEISEDGRDLRYDLTIEDSIDRPEWDVADWFGHHVFLGADDDEGIHINAIVIDATSTSYELVTDNEDIAKVEAMFDIPILGTVSSADLSTQSFGQPWKVYDFPMRHNHRWESDLGFGEPVLFKATYNAEIETPYGIRPGFDVRGELGDGRLVIATDYVPDIGWYSYMDAYDPFEEEPELEFRSLSMGRGKGWAGTYHVYRGSSVFAYDGFATVFAPDSAQPAHYESFDVGEADILIGFLYSFAVQGATDVRLAAPDNTMYSYPVTNAEPNPDPNAWSGTVSGSGFEEFWEVPAQEGQWHFSYVTASAVGGGGGQLWALTGEQIDLAPDAS